MAKVTFWSLWLLLYVFMSKLVVCEILSLYELYVPCMTLTIEAEG